MTQPPRGGRLTQQIGDSQGRNQARTNQISGRTRNERHPQARKTAKTWETGSGDVLTGPTTDVDGVSISATSAGSGTSSSTGIAAVAIGLDTEAAGDHGTALGEAAVAAGNWSAALGTHASSGGDYSVAAGLSADASGGAAVAIGFASEATADSAIAIGFNSKAHAANAIAFGGSTASSAHLITLGTGSHTTRVDGILYATAVIIPGDTAGTWWQLKVDASGVLSVFPATAPPT